MPVQKQPAGYHSVTPYLICKSPAEAIEFYKRAFGATELYRMDGPDGSIMHAEIKIGDSPVMLSGEWPNFDALSPLTRGGTTVSLMIYVDDCDAVFDRAVAAGAKVFKPVMNQFYGDRAGTLIDPDGHKWTVATHVEDVPPDQMTQRFEAWQASQSMA